MAHTCALFKRPWGFSVELVVVYMAISLKFNCCSAPSTGTHPHTTNIGALYSEKQACKGSLITHRHMLLHVGYFTKDYHGFKQNNSL